MYREILEKKFSQLPGSSALDSGILEYIVKHNSAVTYMCSEKFCYECDCTDYELEQFVAAAGFNDYNKLKDFVKEIINSVDAENGYTVSMEDTITRVAEDLVNIEMGNMLDFRNSLDKKTVLRLVEDIINAPEVVILGTRASEAVMSYAVYILNKIGIRTTKLDAANTNYFDHINNIDRSSLVIAVGFARYPKATIVAASHLKRKGFKIASITDFTRSPLVSLSEYSIILKSSSREFTDSYSAAMLLLNLVVVTIEKCNKEFVEKKLKEFDEIAFNMDYYI